MAETAPAGGLGVGTMLAETYKVTGLLGRGGMGSVWAADHARLPGKKVAIKVLHTEVAADDESLARFRREAEIASRLGHPNIVDVHDFNVLPDGSPYLVLEYLEGEDLAARLLRGPLPLDEVASIVRQVGAALAAAHRENIVHRDLKPQNVFLVPTEADGFVIEQAKVLDFGISKIRGSQTVKTNASTMLGTPQYMAPEQALGQHDNVDARTDVFALGAMVYEMLSGRPAFAGQTIPEVVFKVVYEEAPPLSTVAQLPPGVCDAVHKALSKKQDERFASVSEFVAALTGSPLDTLKKGGVIARGDGVSGGAPTRAPSRVVTGGASEGEAFAETVGSGPRAVDPALAGTIASGKHEVEAALAGTVASTNAPVVAPASGAPGKRGPGLAIAAVAVLAAAVAVTVFVMKGAGADDASSVAAERDPPEGEPDPRPIAVTSSLADAAPIPATTDPVPTPDANPDPHGDPKPDPKPVAKPDTRPDPAPEPRDDGERGVTPAIAAELANAEAMLRAGKSNLAMVTAKRTLQDAKTQRAHAVIAKAYCQMNNLGMANANLHHVKNRRLRRNVAQFCKRAGTELAD